MTWLREKAARAAIGFATLFVILTLAAVWVAFRLTTFPIRKLRPRSAARTAAYIGLAQAVMVLISAERTGTRSSSAGSRSDGSAGASTEETEDDAGAEVF